MAQSQAADWLERATTGSRRRNAAALFLGGRTNPLDRLVSAAYFTVAARRWARYDDAEHHLAAFRAGLATCAGARDVLDLGTGAGGSAALVAGTWPQARVVGIDTSRTMLRAARARHSLPNLEFRRADVRSLPFEAASFDLVTMVNAVPEPVELVRVCRPGAAVLTAATVLPVRDESSEWVARWHEVGFRREGAGDVEGGSWERYVREAGV